MYLFENEHLVKIAEQNYYSLRTQTFYRIGICSSKCLNTD